MRRFFVKRKDYDLLIKEMQELQEKHNELKHVYEISLNENRQLSYKNMYLKKDNDFLTFSKKRLLDKFKNDNESKNKHIDSLIQENIELHKTVAEFKINTFNSIQENIKSRKKIRVRNKQNKKLNENTIQRLVNLALEME